MSRRAFTLIELLVVIAIIAVLAIVVILTLNPAQLLMQARDSNRLSDIASISQALGYYRTDVSSGSLGTASTTYVSVPDSTATSTAGDQCQGLGLPSSSVPWQCGASSTYRKGDGTGWVPANLASISFGSPLGQLPQDPTNQTSSNLFYTYQTNGTQYEVTAVMESTKYKSQLAANPMVPNYPEVAAQGTNLTLSALWNASGLVGYWPMDEGSGSSTADQSGNNNAASWSGASGGINGTHYVSGKVGGYAGTFDGSTNQATAANAASLNMGTGDFTFTAWIKVSGGDAGNYRGVIDKGNWDSNWPHAILAVHGGRPAFSMGDGSTTFQTNFNSSFVNDGVWHFIVVTVAHSDTTHATVTPYVDGLANGTPRSQVMNGTGSVTAAASLLYIGYSQGGTYFPGSLDDIRFYNRTLSAAEIQALYNTQK